jgi:uncharacterized protein with GYD domain
MPIYIGLMKLTEQGAKDIKNAPESIKNAIKASEAAGGKNIGFYVTMGEYDYVVISEQPSDEATMLQLAGIASNGLVKTKTLKAFTLDEFEEIVKKLP